jgi:dihydropteroate synthase
MHIDWSWPRGKPVIMGVLNLTPDSFYDGGKHQHLDQILGAVQSMIDGGLDLLDLGGESSRPGADSISIEEEKNRVLPVVDALVHHYPNLILSIDTVKAPLAYEAMKKGVRIINDIRGFRDQSMRDVAKETQAHVVVMHMKGIPKNMQDQVQEFDSFFNHLYTWLFEQTQQLQKDGIPSNRISIDPGLGFGKTLNQNLEISVRLSELSQMGFPIVFGPSRKSFLGHLLNRPPQDRLSGTIASCVHAYLQGANIFRVHDVIEVSDALKVTHALKQFTS